MKCWLDQLPLRGVQWFFAGEQAVAHHGAATLHHRPAHLFRGVHYEKLLHEAGMVQQIGVPRAKLEMRYVAIVPGEILQVREWIAAKRPCLAQPEDRPRPGRYVGSGHACAPCRPLPNTKRPQRHSQRDFSSSDGSMCGATSRR